MKFVITVIGKDQVGIIAMVSRELADNNVNILSINQNIMDGFFNMVMLAESNDDKTKLADLQNSLRDKGKAINLEIKIQHEDIFKTMHEV